MRGWTEKKGVRKKIDKLKTRLEDLRSARDSRGMSQYKEASKECIKILRQEDEYWMKRSKAHWLKNGDANTKFFHVVASGRKKKNSIEKLKGDDGKWKSRGQGLEELMVAYYDN